MGLGQFADSILIDHFDHLLTTIIIESVISQDDIFYVIKYMLNKILVSHGAKYSRILLGPFLNICPIQQSKILTLT